jgi:RHS repeat-associated protein
MHNAQFNVEALADTTGDIVERYTFTPYGQRFVLNANWTADGDGLSDVGLNIGHQGLYHDAETGSGGGLIYNRARMLHPVIGRFMQRDPLGYVDGMSLYAAYHVLQGAVDPEGTSIAPGNPLPPGNILVQAGQQIANLGAACNDCAVNQPMPCCKNKLWLASNQYRSRKNYIRVGRYFGYFPHSAVIDWTPSCTCDARGDMYVFMYYHNPAVGTFHFYPYPPLHKSAWVKCH